MVADRVAGGADTGDRAVSYEIIRLSADLRRFGVVPWLSSPSLALQRLTTRDPDQDKSR